MYRNRSWMQLASILVCLSLAACAFIPQKRPLPPKPTNLPSPQEGGQQPTSSPAPPVLETSTPDQPLLPAGSQPLFWQSRVLDPSNKTGYYSTLAVSAAGQALLAYLDDANDALKVVVYRDGAWRFQNPPAAGREGFYPAAAFDPSGKAHAVHFNPDRRAILYISPDEGGRHTETAVEGVDISALVLGFGDGGEPQVAFYEPGKRSLGFATRSTNRWTVKRASLDIPEKTAFSMRFGPDGRLLVAYFRPQGGLVAALCAPKGGCQASSIDSQAVGSQSPAIAFDPQGAWRAAYFDRAQNVMKIASQRAGQWQVETVNAAAQDVRFIALALDAQGRAHLAFYDAGSQELRYALQEGETWNFSLVDRLAGVGPFGSLALDSAGAPRLSYYDSQSRVLKYAFASFPARGADDVKLAARHRGGQTFITWPERADLKDERYRVYRSSAPITSANYRQALLLGETGKNSSRFYANYYDEGDGSHTKFRPRNTQTLVIDPDGPPLPADTGLLVWTLAPEDFGGAQSGQGYYAVTVTPQGGAEIFSPAYAIGPLEESLGDPQPVEISQTPGVNGTANRREYIQYMDLRHWNPTFHAPNSTNYYYGFDPQTPGLANALQYAYDYTVFSPTAQDCQGKLPDRLAIFVFLHGARGNRYSELTKNPYPYCAYGIFPVDVSETWYFGFARDHDYRKGGAVEAGDVIENYTERRILMMVLSLLKTPPGLPADERRVYIYGHSMGGSGALAFAQRYPNVFAAAYSGQPITDYRTSGVTKEDWAAMVAVKWGSPQLDLPVHLSAPQGLADRLQKYNGMGVWEWQNYLAAISRQAADDMVPLGIDHGRQDDVITWSTQGEPFYAALSASRQAWSGLVNDASHLWSVFAGMAPSLGNLDGVQPFWNFSVIRDESVPGLSNMSASPAELPGLGIVYNRSLLWSSSWNPWDGAPLDQPDRWQMSFCALKPGTVKCGSSPLKVDITPRRLQVFKIEPGAQYDWQVIQIAGSKFLSSGTIIADANGILTIPGVEVTSAGVRLLIQKHP